MAELSEDRRNAAFLSALIVHQSGAHLAGFPPFSRRLRRPPRARPRDLPRGQESSLFSFDDVVVPRRCGALPPRTWCVASRCISNVRDACRRCARFLSDTVDAATFDPLDTCRVKVSTSGSTTTITTTNSGRLGFRSPFGYFSLLYVFDGDDNDHLRCRLVGLVCTF